MNAPRRLGSRSLTIGAAIALNAVTILLVILSVLSALNQFREASFQQNVENIQTLTYSSTDKVELLVQNETEEVQTLAGYINRYQGVGMTESEIRAFMFSCFGNGETEWCLVPNLISHDKALQEESFQGFVLTDSRYLEVPFAVVTYTKLAQIFCLATAQTLGEIRYVNEFTDPYSGKASFSVCGFVRILVPGEAGENTYVYATLMKVIHSQTLNEVITKNNQTDTLSQFDYTNAVIDWEGNYVFSNPNFPGKNIFTYLATYDPTLTEEKRETLLEGLRNGEKKEPIYYKNNRGEDCVYNVAKIANTDWYILSVVPLSSFHNIHNSGPGFLRFALSFGLLFAVDVVFILIINRKLRKKTKEANAANEAKSRFLSSMSHDIRTPMNAIIGMTAIAKETLAEPNPDIKTLTECTQTVETSGNYLLTLVNDILDLSKIESGRVTLTSEEFSLPESLCKMIAIMVPQIKEKDFKFQSHIIGVSHGIVKADELRINQIYLNILSNAVKYTPSGGEITVDLIQESIPNKPDFGRFVYRVADTGIGIAEDFQKSIFDSFARAVDSRISTIQGTGLGLSIVKQLVNLMGGSIDVQSKPNAGSTFTITLDLPCANKQEPAKNFPLLVKRSALLIDNDALLLESLRDMLEEYGMSVRVGANDAFSVFDAQSRIKTGKPYDIIFFDWKNCAARLVEDLRRVVGGTGKLIAMTDYTAPDIEKEALAAGVDTVIIKPIYPAKLKKTIDSLFALPGPEKKKPQENTFHLSVLVAEDNYINWQVINRILRRFGITAERAENGQKAVELAESTDYDVIFMDVHMPVMDGYEATDAIRHISFFRHRAEVPIYAMTADAYAEDIAKCLEVGMNGHLAKPIEVDKLLKVLQTIQDKKTAT